MLRAISEMAVAMTVSSPLEKPSFEPSVRLSRRAATMSDSWRIGTRALSACTRRLLPELEQVHALVEIERRVGALERQAQLHHRERDLGLDAHDDRVRAAQ